MGKRKPSKKEALRQREDHHRTMVKAGKNKAAVRKTCFKFLANIPTGTLACSAHLLATSASTQPYITRSELASRFEGASRDLANARATLVKDRQFYKKVIEAVEETSGRVLGPSAGKQPDHLGSTGDYDVPADTLREIYSLPTGTDREWSCSDSDSWVKSTYGKRFRESAKYNTATLSSFKVAATVRDLQLADVEKAIASVNAFFRADSAKFDSDVAAFA